MLSRSIRSKIVAIASAVIILMAVTAMMTMVFATRVSTRMDEIATIYIPAYRDIARANIRSLERAVTVRRIVIAKLQSSLDKEKYAALLQKFKAQGDEVERELLGVAQDLLRSLIENGSGFGDAARLGQLESRARCHQPRHAGPVDRRNGAPAADTR